MSLYETRLGLEDSKDDGKSISPDLPCHSLESRMADFKASLGYILLKHSNKNGQHNRWKGGCGTDRPPLLLTCCLTLLSMTSRAWANSRSRAQGTAESVAPTKGGNPGGKNLES